MTRGLWLLTVLLWCGCGTASLWVVLPAEVDEPVEGVYVVVEKGPYDAIYAKDLAVALVKALAGHTKMQKGVIVTGLELDARSVPFDIRRSGADAVLWLHPTGGLQVRTSVLTTVVAKIYYIAYLRDAESNDLIWEAKLEWAGGTTAAATKIVDALITNHALKR